MKITEVETFVLDTSGEVEGHGYRREWGIVCVHTDEGITGLSRASAGALPVVASLAPVIVGHDPLEHERLWQEMYATTHAGGYPQRQRVWAIGTLDIALWDIKGKSFGQPVWRLLGGFRHRVPAYADGYMGIYDGDTPSLVRALARFAEQGFRQVKIHIVHRDPQAAVADLAEVRAAVGPSVQVMLDAHRAWDPWTAAGLIQRFADHDLYWLEEPVQWDDQVGGLAVVAAACSRVLVAAGEGECTLYAARDLVARGGVRVLQVDIMGGGGYTAALKYAALAQAFHVQLSPHAAHFPELNAPLVAAVPNGLTVSTTPPTEPYQLWSRLYREPLDVRDGWITLRERPGLGLELDADFVARHRRATV
jgi:L-alanine-DL-glutamate epimerase-like enolase superfamily enzyme